MSVGLKVGDLGKVLEGLSRRRRTRQRGAPSCVSFIAHEASVLHFARPPQRNFGPCDLTNPCEMTPFFRTQVATSSPTTLMPAVTRPRCPPPLSRMWVFEGGVKFRKLGLKIRI